MSNLERAVANIVIEVVEKVALDVDCMKVVE